MALSSFTLLFNQHQHPAPVLFHPKLQLPPSNSNSPSHSSKTLVTTFLLSFSTDLSIPHASQKWDQTVFILCVWITSLGLKSLRFIHVTEFPFSFLSLNNIAVCIDCILFIQSFTDEQKCFHLLAMVSNTAVNILYKHLAKYLLSILLGIYPEVELMGYIVVLCLICWGT